MILSLLTSGNSIPIIIMQLIAVVISATVAIVFHEFSHAFVAHLCGDDTAKNTGRMSINPLAHFDWIGLILLAFVGFGWAKPVPVNPYYFKNTKVGIVLVSLAGIVANLLMAGFGLFLLYFLYPVCVTLLSSATAVRLFGYLLYGTLAYFTVFNITLAFFNLLPIAPLDGFNFVNSFLPRGNAYSSFMFRYGWYVLLGLLILSHILNYVGLKEYNVFYQIQQLAWRLVDFVTVGLS